MVHIKLGEGLPGIRGALAFSPETRKPLVRTGRSVTVRPANADSGGTRDDRSLHFFAE
jgi:hypothetical protein